MNQQVTASTLLRPTWNKAPTKEELLQNWLDVQVELALTKDREMEARKAVVAAFPFPEDAKEGTHTLDLANGYKLKVALKQNYNLDNETIDATLDAFEAMGANDVEKALNADVAKRLVKFKAELSITEYRNLTPVQLAVFENSLTITDGTPCLTLVQPKAKK